MLRRSFAFVRHMVLKDGVFSIEVRAFMEATGVERDTLKTALQSTAWVYPKVHDFECKQLWRIFDHRRVSSQDPQKVKASCKELLGVFALVRHFVEERVPMDPAHDAARSSFLAVCKVLDLLLTAKFRYDAIDSVAAELEVRMSCVRIPLIVVASCAMLLALTHLGVPTTSAQSGCVRRCNRQPRCSSWSCARLRMGSGG